jgi:hypothetical protein
VYDLIRTIWEKEEVPKEWGGGLLVPLFKSGSKEDPDNYRGIALLNVTCKVLTSLLNDRVSRIAEKKLLEEQAGFRSGRGTTDQLFSLRQVIEKHIEHNNPLCMAFVDLKKAYDSVSRPLLLDILRAEGLPKKLVSLIEKLYEKTTLRVRLRGQIGRQVQISSGVRQGCVLSPVLFNLFLNYLLKTILPELEERGVLLQYRIGNSLFKLDVHEELQEKKMWGFLYADDLVLLAETKQKLHDSLRLFDTLMTRAGMELSISKTKTLRSTISCDSESLNFDLGSRGIVNEVSEFKYLGSIVSAEGSLSSEISSRIAKAGGAFAVLKRSVFSVRSISREVKLKVYSASVLSVLLYGCETWNCTVADVQRLEVFHNRCLRCICGLSKLSHVTNFDLKKLTGQKSIQSLIMTSRLRWLGHVMRMSAGRAPKQILFSRLATSRPQGKPRQRWKDSVSADIKAIGLEKEWSEVALFRDQWFERTNSGIAKVEAEKNIAEEREYRRKKERGGIRCEQCDFKAKNERGLKIHENSVHWGKWIIEDFTSQSALPNVKVFVCGRCGKDCHTAAGLSSHKRGTKCFH